MRRRHSPARVMQTLALVVFLASVVSAQGAPVDPLPGWNNGPAKKAIVEFVSRVTKKGGPDFVPVSERIATFDNDGTLWWEQPLYFQFAFALSGLTTGNLTSASWTKRLTKLRAEGG